MMLGSIASTSRLTLSSIGARTAVRINVSVSALARKSFTSSSSSFSTYVSHSKGNGNGVARAATSPCLRYGTTRWIHSTYRRGNALSTNSNSNTLTTSEYERISSDDMDKLHESLEVLVEDFGGEKGWEVEYSSGVMTLALPPHGTYVINKQPPNLQIWISSPFSGPGRFDYTYPSSPSSPSTTTSTTISGNGNGSGDGEKTWVHHRDSSIRLDKLLDGELRQVLRQDGVDDEDWDGVDL